MFNDWKHADHEVDVRVKATVGADQDCFLIACIAAAAIKGEVNFMRFVFSMLQTPCHGTYMCSL